MFIYRKRRVVGRRRYGARQVGRLYYTAILVQIPLREGRAPFNATHHHYPVRPKDRTARSLKRGGGVPALDRSFPINTGITGAALATILQTRKTGVANTAYLDYDAIEEFVTHTQNRTYSGTHLYSSIPVW